MQCHPPMPQRCWISGWCMVAWTKLIFDAWCFILAGCLMLDAQWLMLDGDAQVSSLDRKPHNIWSLMLDVDSLLDAQCLMLDAQCSMVDVGWLCTGVSSLDRKPYHPGQWRGVRRGRCCCCCCCWWRKHSSAGQHHSSHVFVPTLSNPPLLCLRPQWRVG